MPDISAHRATFRKLHESGCFVMPNPWDVGTAHYLRHLGFPALATTSSGFAFSRGLPDGEQGVTRDQMLQHIAELVSAADLPVNADFQSGYAHTPDKVAENVQLCLKTGVAGISIEDASGDADNPLYDRALSVDRIKAVRAAIDESGTGVLLTARAECFLVGHPDPLEEAIARLELYAEAGADVLYAPGVRERGEIQVLVHAVSPKSLNVLMSTNTGLRVADLAEAGVRRISVGSSLARAAWTAFIRAATAIAEQGDFSGFEDLVPFNQLNDLFRADYLPRISLDVPPAAGT